MIPVSDHRAPINFEEWLPLRGRWLRLFLAGIPTIGLALLLGAVLAGTFSTGYVRCYGKGPRGAAKAQIANFGTAVELYRVDHGGTCPVRLLDLIYRPAGDAGSTRWKGPYLQDLTSVPPDPWGHPYVYQLPGPDGGAYEIRSLGKDGSLGGTADAEDLSSVPR